MTTRGSQVVSLRTTESIENEAADWLTKLDAGNFSADNRRALKQWLAQDTEHVSALTSLASMWSDMGTLLNDFPEVKEPSWLETFSQFVRYKSVPFALSVLLICAIGLFFGRAIGPVELETSFHVTKIGKQRLETFSDGSSAQLNTNSILEVEFTESVRIVRLLRGEAMFNVAHDAERPFIVYAGNRSVKAIGTKFVVRLEPENILLTVAEGKVSLSRRVESSGELFTDQEKEAMFVTKGEIVEVRGDLVPSEPVQLGSDELNRRLSWLSGHLEFENEQLGQVIEEVNRYIPEKIIIDDPELLDVRISGRFETGDTDALLGAIEISFNVLVSYTDDQVIHLSRMD